MHLKVVKFHTEIASEGDQTKKIGQLLLQLRAPLLPLHLLETVNDFLKLPWIQLTPSSCLLLLLHHWFPHVGVLE